MELRTTFDIDPSRRKINYDDPVMFIGSCFAKSIGDQFKKGYFPVMINPSGTVYNPVSVCDTLDTITGGTKIDEGALLNYNGLFVSLDHYTDFSSDSAVSVIEKINRKAEEAHLFLSSAKFLFVTFGTSRVFRWKTTGKIVSNCHKIPASNFSHELLSVDEITSLWNQQLDKLGSLFPGLKVIFTISPVRHWKDGAHGNQVSKSVLFLAVEELLKHSSEPCYFPAYELVMDDLRDYRFYEPDMLHISDQAVDYIWENFCNCYFDDSTKQLWKETENIWRAVSHRIQYSSVEEVRKFADKMISKIDFLSEKYKGINLHEPRDYFTKLKNK